MHNLVDQLVEIKMCILIAAVEVLTHCVDCFNACVNT